MIQLLTSLVVTRWQDLRARAGTDGGASTVEYTILVAIGVVVATLVAGLVYDAVKTHSADIK